MGIQINTASYDTAYAYNLEQKVYIVDDDAGLRDSLKWLLESEGMVVEIYRSAAEFLDIFTHEVNNLKDEFRQHCLLTDVCMPEMNGLELQDQLISRKIDIPMIFISGQCTAEMAEQALQKGAVRFIHKPFKDSVLLDCIGQIFSSGSTR